MNYATAKECVVCGELFPVPPKEKTPEEVVLELLVENNIKGKRLSELNINELILLQTKKNIQSGIYLANYSMDGFSI